LAGTLPTCAGSQATSAGSNGSDTNNGNAAASTNAPAIVVTVTFGEVISVSNTTAFLADNTVPIAIIYSFVNASNTLQNLLNQGLITFSVNLTVTSRRVQAGARALQAGKVQANVVMSVTANSSSFASTCAQQVSTAVSGINRAQLSSGITAALTQLGDSGSYGASVLSVSPPVATVNGAPLQPGTTVKMAGTSSDAARFHHALHIGSCLFLASLFWSV